MISKRCGVGLSKLLIVLAVSICIVFTPVHKLNKAEAVAPAVGIFLMVTAVSVGLATADTFKARYLDGEKDSYVLAQLWVQKFCWYAAIYTAVALAPVVATSTAFGGALATTLGVSAGLLADQGDLSDELFKYLIANTTDMLTEEFVRAFGDDFDSLFLLHSAQKTLAGRLMNAPVLLEIGKSFQPTEEQYSHEIPEPTFYKLRQVGGVEPFGVIPLSGYFTQTFEPYAPGSRLEAGSSCRVFVQHRETGQIIDSNVSLSLYDNQLTLVFQPDRSIPPGVYDVNLKFDLNVEGKPDCAYQIDFHLVAKDAPEEPLQMPTVVEEAVRHSLNLPAHVAITDELALRVTGLDLYEAGLSTLEPWIRKFENLKTLDISGNELMFLPVGLMRLHLLEELDIRGNPFSEFPVVAFELPALKELNAGRIGVSVVPENIEFLRNLEELDLRGNPIQGLPDTLRNMPNLRELNLRDCGLREVPPIVFFLKELRRLRLDDNHLSETPGDYSKLTKLESLNLGGNRLSVISPYILSMQSLKQLSLDDNRLSEIPAGIDGLVNLEDLDISSLGLNSLPDRLWNLSKLKTLELSRNALDQEDLTGKLCRLSGLEELFIDHNVFNKLPGDILELEKLDNLDFDDNDIPCTSCDERDPILLQKDVGDITLIGEMKPGDIQVVELPSDGAVYSIANAPEWVAVSNGLLMVAPGEGVKPASYPIRFLVDNNVYVGVVVQLNVTVHSPGGWLVPITKLLLAY